MEAESKKNAANSNPKKNSDNAPNNSGGGGEGKRGTRGGRKRNNRRGKRGAGGGGGGGSGGQKKSSVPPPPQTKITFRKIGNADKYGSVKQVMELVRSMLNSVESTNFAIELEEATVRRLVTEDELYQAAVAEEVNKTESEETKGTEEDKEGVDDADMPPNLPTDDVNASLPKATSDEAKKGGEDSSLDVIIAPKNSSLLPTITARPLFVLPPKKTRRRGERAGCAYVVFTGPKIDPHRVDKEAPIKETSTELNPASSEGNSMSPADASPADAPAMADPDIMEVVNSNVTSGEDDDPALTSANDEITADAVGSNPAEGKVPTSSPKSASQPAAPISKSSHADYSRAVAKGRLLLKNAVDALIQLADQDAKTQQLYAGCIVEESMSGKTWRHQNHRPDRREGSIETTSDFKNWLQSLAKQEEDLKARPKPAPGGGSLAMSTGVDGTTIEDGQQLSAIVIHLRAKRQEAKRKKAKKKKEKNDKAKGKKKKEGSKQRGGGGANSEPNSKGGGRRDAGKKKRKKKNPKTKDGNSKDSTGAPPTLLKPPAAGKANAAPG